MNTRDKNDDIRLLSITQQNVRIAVVIPCYNVEPWIASILRDIPDWVDDIVVVDDASVDATPSLLDEMAAASPNRIIALHHKTNQGVGAAMLTGMDEALRRGNDIIVKIDGDGQMNLDHLPDVVRPLLDGEADYAKGSRFHSLDVLKKMPPMRLFGNAGLSLLTRIASGYWDVLDPTNGFVAIWADIYTKIPKERLHPRFFFESSMLIELGILRAVVQDVPMATIYGNEKSTLSTWKSLVEFPPKLFVGFCRRIWLTKVLLTTTPDFILGFLGLILLLFGGSFGIYRWIFSSLEGEIATAGTVMLAALPCLVGLQMMLFALLIDIQSVPKRKISYRSLGRW